MNSRNKLAAVEQVAIQSFDVFISYSRKDSAFASRLYRALDRYTPPFKSSGRKRLSVFLDQSDLTGVDYFKAIDQHLSNSKKLIVVCSPESATSEYVNDEIERFVRLHGDDAVVPVLIRGLPNNEAADGSDERAFSPALVQSMQMPLAVDYRGFDAERERVDSSEHQSAWIGLLANLLDRPRAEVEQREARRRRKRLRIWSGAVATLVAALSALTVWALVEGERALAGRLAAQAKVPTGLDTPEVEHRALLAREAVQRLARLGEPTLAGETPLRSALAQSSRRLLELPPGNRSFSFASDGKRFIVAEDERLRVLRLDGGAERQDVRLTKPLHHVEAALDLRHVVGLDETGGVVLWSWPSLKAVAPLPPEVLSAPVDCIGFDPSGQTLFALRLVYGKQREAGVRVSGHAEIVRWMPGETTLRDSAQVQLPARPNPLVAANACLEIRQSVLIARLSDAGEEGLSAPSLVVLRWPVRSLVFVVPGTQPEPVEVREGVTLAALGANGYFRFIAELPPDSGGQASFKEDRENSRGLVPDRFAPTAFSFDAQWMLVSQPKVDPYVPLLKSTRFEVIDTASGDVFQELADQAGTGLFTPDSRQVATISGRRVRMWDRQSGVEVRRLFARGAIASVHFDAASLYAAVVMRDGSVDVFAIGEVEGVGSRTSAHKIAVLGGSLRLASALDHRLIVEAPEGKENQSNVLEIEGYIDAMHASPDGRWLALKVLPEKPMFRIRAPLDTDVWLVQTSPTLKVRHRGKSVRGLRFDAGSERLVTWTAMGQLRVFNLNTPNGVPREINTERNSDPRVSLSDNGQVLIVSDRSGLSVYADGNSAPSWQDAQPTELTALSSDGALFARLMMDGKLRVQNSGDGKVVRELKSDAIAEPRDLVFSPNAQRLMGVGGTSAGTFFGTGFFVEEHLAVWDINTGEVIDRLPRHADGKTEYQDEIGSRADEFMLFSGLVWNRLTRDVAAVVFPSVLGYWTLSAERVDSQIQAWQLTDEGLVEVFRTENPNKLETHALASGGRVLTLKSGDGFKRVIDGSGKRLPELACRWIKRPFTEQERRTALGSGLRRPLGCLVNTATRDRDPGSDKKRMARENTTN